MNAVFFDVDGTLFDTRADLAGGVNHTRRDLGLEELPLDVVISHVGQGSRYLMEHCISESPMPFDELWSIYSSHYAEHCCDKLVMYPGVRETLDELKRRGWLLGVNTNKPNFAVKLIFEKFDLGGYFGDAVVAGGDGVPLKPDRRSIEACAARIGGHVLFGLDGRRRVERHAVRSQRRSEGGVLLVRLREPQGHAMRRETRLVRRHPRRGRASVVFFV